MHLSRTAIWRSLKVLGPVEPMLGSVMKIVGQIELNLSKINEMWQTDGQGKYISRQDRGGMNMKVVC